MAQRTDVPVGMVIDLTQEVIGLDRRTGRARLMVRRRGGPPRIDGYTVGAPRVTGDSPHGGEVHPDADELLILVSGRIEVRLELDEAVRAVEVSAGQAVVVPRGVWHRIVIREPAQLVHITPGPGGAHRPTSAAR